MVKKFIRVYYEWGCGVTVLDTKMTMEKYDKKFIEGYEKYNGSGVKVQKIPGDPGMTQSKSELE